MTIQDISDNDRRNWKDIHEGAGHTGTFHSVRRGKTRHAGSEGGRYSLISYIIGK